MEKIQVPGFPDYEVTRDGRVWSNKGRGRWLKPGIASGGYPLVGLMRDGRQYSRKVHVLVALAFLGPRPEGHDVCHNNGNPADNRVENLRYDTRSANLRDAVRHGTQKPGPGRPVGYRVPEDLEKAAELRKLLDGVDFTSS